MKKIITFLLLLFSIVVSAQKELWGITRQTNFSDVQGNIVKFDINGENAFTAHHFSYATGKLPDGKLFLASNGKLYGTTSFGGHGSTSSSFDQDGYGVLYEYDLNFDNYRVVHYFDFPANPSGNASVNPYNGVIEPIPGKLYGGVNNRFYVYDIATETVTFLNHTYPLNGATGKIYSDIIKASNGFLYAISDNTTSCTSPDPQPNMGTVIKIDTATNTAQKVANFKCDNSVGEGSNGILIEALPNRIFFTSGGGYQWLPVEGFAYPAGTLIEFNTETNTLASKVTFNVNSSLGFLPSSLVLGDNGNLYGVCGSGGDTYRSPYTSGVLNKTGTLFEYNPTTNAIVKLTEFLTFQNLPQNIIKLTTGDLMGNLAYGSLFRYNINTNTLHFPDGLTYSDSGNQFYTQNLLEICRKSSYHFFDVDTFDSCVGSTFTYDVQNTNATSYQWFKNGTDVPGQTTGVLNLTNLQTTNAGNYTCIMTNECGTTTTMILHLTINCLETNTSADLDKSVKLYPNPTKDILNVKLPENVDVTITNIKIANSLGQIIRDQKTQNNHTIDVSQLQTGIYFISLITNYGNWDGKFVKQ